MCNGPAIENTTHIWEKSVDMFWGLAALPLSVTVHLNFSPGDQQHVHSMAVGKHNIDNSPAFPAAYLAQVSSTSPPVTETQRRYCSHFEDWGLEPSAGQPAGVLFPLTG